MIKVLIFYTKGMNYFVKILAPGGVLGKVMQKIGDVMILHLLDATVRHRELCILSVAHAPVKKV